MAKNKAEVTLKVTDGGSLKETGKKAKQTAKDLDGAAKGAHSVDRRLKGAARASSNSTKNFSKMSQGISGGLVPAYATLAASMFAVSAVFRGLEKAFNWKAQGEGLVFFAQQSGIAMESLVRDMRAATAGLLEFEDAAQAVQIGIASGLDPKALVDLAEGAKLVSGALGRDLTDSFNRLIRGVTKAEPELLDELGIVLRLDIATRKYAAAHGLVQNELTLTQRMAAVNAEVMDQLNTKFGEFRGKADELANPITRLQTAFTDLMMVISEKVVPVIEPIANFLSENTQAAALLMAGFAAGILKSAFPALKGLSASMVKFGVDSGKASKQATGEFKKASAAYKRGKADWNATDVVHKNKFKAILKKMGIDHKVWLKKKVIDQERSIAMMLANEKKAGAKVKLLKAKELAYLRTVHGQIAASHQAMTAKMIAGANAASLALSAGMVKASAVSGAALGALGALATRLAPTFAFLGSAMSWLFGIATLAFIGKMIWDWAKGAGVFDSKANQLDKTWEGIYAKLEEIDKLQTSQINNIDNALAGTNEYNKALIKQANIYKNLADLSKLEEGLTGGIDGSQMVALTDYYAQWLGAAIADAPDTAVAIMEKMRVGAGQTVGEGGNWQDAMPSHRYNEYGGKSDKSWIKEVEQADFSTDKGQKTFSDWLNKMLPLLAGNETLLRSLGIELNKLGQTDAVKAGSAIQRLGLELESLGNIQSRLTSKFKLTPLQQYHQALKGVIKESAAAEEHDPNYSLDATLKAAKIDPASLGIEEGDDNTAALKHVKNTEQLVALSQKLSATLNVRVARYKRLAAISSKLGDTHGKQEARSFEIAAKKVEAETLTAKILAEQVLYETLRNTDQAENAAAKISADMLTLENLGYQIEALKEMDQLWTNIRDKGIQAFDSAGTKGLKDIILGEEKSLGDAVLNLGKSTLEGMATALSEKMMSPITGAFKKMLGVEDPEVKRERILKTHVKEMRTALEDHVKALGGDKSIIADVFDPKSVTKTEEKTGENGVVETITTEGIKKGFATTMEDIMGGLFGSGGGLSDFFGMFSGMFGGFFGAANGGLIRKYGSGTGPAGAKVVPGRGTGDTVPALLTPGELVIPRGKRIGGKYNTTINVNMEGASDVTTDDETGEALGIAIQSAVTQEIQNQQLPGGLLSPIGG